jgi:hypothetical protein
MPEGSQNGWNEYSRLVLKELETLADGINGLRSELQEVRQELAKMQVREDKVDDLKTWKDKVDEVCSPLQLKELIDEVANLKTFKTKAITIFAAAQVGMGILVWACQAFF